MAITKKRGPGRPRNTTTAANKRRTTKTMRAGAGNKSKNRATARGR